MNYCPKCRSRLFPDDEKYIDLVNACGACVSYDRSPGKALQKLYLDRLDDMALATKLRRKKERKLRGVRNV